MFQLQIVEPFGVVKGGPGSGFHGHAGRPGKRGGSAPAGTAPAETALPTEQDLISGQWESLSTGTSASNIWKVTTPDGKNWFVKQPSGYYEEDGFDEVADEVAASILGDALGLPVLPVAGMDIGLDSPIHRDLDRKSTQSLLVSPWLDNVTTYAKKMAGEPKDAIGLSDDDIVRFSLFDFVIANYDRHKNNLVFDANDKPILIDQGLAFNNDVMLVRTPFFWDMHLFAPVEPEMVGWLEKGIQKARAKAWDQGNSVVIDRIDFAETRFELFRRAYDDLERSDGLHDWNTLRDRLNYDGGVRTYVKGGPGSGFHGHAGRPGKRGGSAPAGTVPAGESPLSTEEVEAKIAALEKSIFRRKTEVLLVIDDEGNEVTRIKGTKNQVAVSDDDVAAMKGKYIMHNHPTGWKFDETDPRHVGNSFSRDDIRAACIAEAKQIRAVTPKYTFTMLPPPGGWNEDYWRNTLLPAVTGMNERVKREFLRKIETGKMTREEADATHYHTLWTWLMSTYGFYYQRVEHGYSA